VLGVAAAQTTHSNVLVAGVAGLVAGSISMAAGEYVSVHSQADTEQAELELECAELEADEKGEQKELMAIYISRGLDPSLAKQVVEQLMAPDAIGAHERDELGISETFRARPIQAALASAGCFALGAAMPLLVTAMAPEPRSDHYCFGNFAGVSRNSGRVGCTPWWSRSSHGCNTRNVLGCNRHGDDCRRRVAVRNSSVSGADWRLGVLCTA
jgi:VIT family